MQLVDTPRCLKKKVQLKARRTATHSRDSPWKPRHASCRTQNSPSLSRDERHAEALFDSNKNVLASQREHVCPSRGRRFCREELGDEGGDRAGVAVLRDAKCPNVFGANCRQRSASPRYTYETAPVQHNMGICRVAPRAQGCRPAPGRASPATVDDTERVVRRPAVAVGGAASPVGTPQRVRAQVALHRAEPVVHAVGGAAHPSCRGEDDLVINPQRGR